MKKAVVAVAADTVEEAAQPVVNIAEVAAKAVEVALGMRVHSVT